MPLTIDRKTWPILTFVGEGKITKKEVEEWGVALDAGIDFCRSRRFKIAILQDMTRVESTDPAARKTGADYVLENHKDIKQHVACFAWIMKSSVIRGMLTAFTWLIGQDRMPVPYKVFSSHVEATAWCKEQIRLKVGDTNEDD